MMKKFFGFARRKSSSSLKGINPRRFSIGSSASSTLQIQVVRGGYNVDLGKVDASFTKLHKAALLNDEDKLRKHIKNFDVNSRDSSGRTPLHLAVVNGNLNMIRTLIEAGANINLQDADGKTPLFKSVECNHDDLVQFLIHAGADPNLADFENGNTSLHMALSSGSVRATRYLLRDATKLDVNKRNNQSEISLHLAVKLPPLSVVIDELISKGCQLEAKDDRGKTPMLIAVANDNQAAISILLKHGAKTCSNEDRISIKSQDSSRSQQLMSRVQNVKNLDPNDSWPDTDDDEDSNYEKPKIRKDKDRDKDKGDSPSQVTAAKPRKESFKRVSSLVDETIVEEYKEDTGDDDVSRCKPTTSQVNNVKEPVKTVKDDKKDNNLIWHNTSSDDEETTEDETLETTRSTSGTHGKIGTMQGKEEVWKANETKETNRESKEQTSTSQERNLNGSRKTNEDHPHHESVNAMDFNFDVFLADDVTHDKTVSFIQKLEHLIDEEPPPPTKPKLSPTISAPTPTTKTQVYQVNQMSEVQQSTTQQTLQYQQTQAVVCEPRRRSYAEVVAQPKQSNQPQEVTYLNELKTSIASRSQKSYADVTSPKKAETRSAKSNQLSPINKRHSPKKSPAKSAKTNGHQEVQANVLIKRQNSFGKSKIPLPLSSSPTEVKEKIINGTSKFEQDKNLKNKNSFLTTSEESFVSSEEDFERRDLQKLITQPLQTPPEFTSNETIKKESKPQNSAINTSSDLQLTVTQLRMELDKERHEKSLLAADMDVVREQLNQLRRSSQDESIEKLELEKRLIQLDGELRQMRYSVEMKLQEIKGLKEEKNQLINQVEEHLKVKHQFEMDNQKLQNQINKLTSDNEALERDKKLFENERTVQMDVKQDESQLVFELRSKVDQLINENFSLRTECERAAKSMMTKQLEYEKEKFEYQKKLLEIESELKRLQYELERQAQAASTSEDHQELTTAIKDLNYLIGNLESRLSKSEEQQQQKVRSFNEEMFDCARSLLDQIRSELTNFKEMLTNTANDQKSSCNGKSEADEKQLKAFELRITALRTSLERLEDQIQSQELQLIRQSDSFISFAQPLRKSSSTRDLFLASNNNKPRSWFVQTLFRLQQQIHAPAIDSISAFAHEKFRLQKQIHELKAELGLFAESVH